MRESGAKTILIVEDDAEIAEPTEISLRRLGHHVVIARSGEQAQAVVGAGTTIDLALIDLNLGAGLDATEAAHGVLRERDIPVVFAYSHTAPETVDTVNEIPAYGFIEKSSGTTVLGATIEIALRLFDSDTLRKRSFTTSSSGIVSPASDESLAPARRKKVHESASGQDAPAAHALKHEQDTSYLDTLKLEEIIDVPAFQSLLENLYRITGMGGAMVDNTGNVLVGVGWQDICTKFHRQHSKTRQYCLESDTYLASGAVLGEYKTYLCKNGMHDVATPIIIDDRHMGNIYFGQFFFSDETPDLDRFRRQARQYGFDEGKYLDALDRVPSYDRETIGELMSFYSKLAQMISTLGLNAVKLTKALTMQQQSEREIREQLRQKEILVREVHHRIKNNITSIEGFLSMQAGSTFSREAKEALQQAIARVQSIRTLYDALLIGKDQTEVSVKRYIEGVVEALLQVSPENAHITIEQRITDFPLNTKKAVPVGIVANELLTNTFKYAFPGREKGHVSVKLDKTDTHAILTIQDDGIGMDERKKANTSPGFGLTIVKMLAEQLEGSYSVTTDDGTMNVLEFKLSAD